MWQKSRDLFMSYSIDDDSTFDAMKFYNNKYGYVMDPHTAVAADAVYKLNDKLDGKTIILSTADPAKFPLALKNAGLPPSLPNKLSSVLDKKEVAHRLSSKDDSIFEFIKNNN